MNNALRKAINVRNMLRRKYDKQRSAESWEKYKKYRNLVTKLRKQSQKYYLKKKCVVEGNGKDFWQTVKPLISHKSPK